MAAGGVARGWDSEFESALLQRRVTRTTVSEEPGARVRAMISSNGSKSTRQLMIATAGVVCVKFSKSVMGRGLAELRYRDTRGRLRRLLAGALACRARRRGARDPRLKTLTALVYLPSGQGLDRRGSGPPPSDDSKRRKKGRPKSRRVTVRCRFTANGNTIRGRRKPRGSPCSISDRVEGSGAACSGVGSITHVRTGDTKR